MSAPIVFRLWLPLQACVALWLPPIWILTQAFKTGQLFAVPALYCLLSSLVKSRKEFGLVASVVLCVREVCGWFVLYIQAMPTLT
jgi:hypothetical protein